MLDGHQSRVFGVVVRQSSQVPIERESSAQLGLDVGVGVFRTELFSSSKRSSKDHPSAAGEISSSAVLSTPPDLLADRVAGDE